MQHHDGYGKLAPVYHGLEFICFGRLLERAREEHITALAGCRNILILGEGDGRFLCRLHSVAPRAQVTVVDKSPGMLRTARRRLQRSLGRIPSGWTTICDDFLEWNCPAQAVPFDALVTHFFLDQFQKETQEWILSRMETLLSPRARWLCADFDIPQNGLRARLQRGILFGFYGFFRHIGRIEARSLHPYRKLLREWNWSLQAERSRAKGWLISDLWVKNAFPRTPNTVNS